MLALLRDDINKSPQSSLLHEEICHPAPGIPNLSQTGAEKHDPYFFLATNTYVHTGKT